MHKVLVFRLLGLIVSFLPLRLSYAGGRMLGALLTVTPSPRRSAVRANLSVVHGVPTNHPLVLRDTKRVFQHAQLNYVDLLRMGRADTADHIRRIPVPDWRPLLDALALGKGAILVSGHIGNFDTLGQLLGIEHIRSTVPIQPIQPPELLTFIQAQRQAFGVQMEPVGPDTFRHLVATLRNNGVVVIMCDRDIQGTGRETVFFGRKVAMPTAAILLSWRTGAPIFGAFGYRHPDGSISGRSTPYLHTARPTRRTRPAQDDTAGGQRSKVELDAAMQELASLLEREIRRDPGQWVVQQPVFHSRPQGKS